MVFPVIHIHIHHHVEIKNSGTGTTPNLSSMLRDILDRLEVLRIGVDRLSPELQALQREVQRARDVEEGAIALLEGLASQINAAKDDPQALQELADQISAESDRLAAAITVNTTASNGPQPPSGMGRQPASAGGTATPQSATGSVSMLPPSAEVQAAAAPGALDPQASQGTPNLNPNPGTDAGEDSAPGQAGAPSTPQWPGNANRPQ